MDFVSFVDEIKKNKLNVYGVEVYKDRELIHSYGDTVEHVYDIYSATKSVTSIAVGVAYDRGVFDINRRILDYIPPDYVNRMSEEQRELFDSITVERLLCMSVDGIPFRAECENFLNCALESKLVAPEQRVFNYSNLSTYLVCVALTEALSEDLGEFIEREIFVPLGIDKYSYERSPEGYFYGASKMKLTVNELSRIGLLMSDSGIYNGNRILSEAYVRMATSVRQMNREGGYGYYFWKYRDGFSINGKKCQKCYVLPNDGLVISYLCNMDDPSHILKFDMERNLLN
ncbi:MAG: serine hydrolase [Clostridia bacterium]|nr:serine hydrolase [Clostridia bacterium]